MTTTKQAVKMFKTLQKSYGWRAARYDEDAKAWMDNGKIGLANYYKGRAKECSVMIEEIEDIINSIKIT